RLSCFVRSVSRSADADLNAEDRPAKRWGSSWRLADRAGLDTYADATQPPKTMRSWRRRCWPGLRVIAPSSGSLITAIVVASRPNTVTLSEGSLTRAIPFE